MGNLWESQTKIWTLPWDDKNWENDPFCTNKSCEVMLMLPRLICFSVHLCLHLYFWDCFRYLDLVTAKRIKIIPDLCQTLGVFATTYCEPLACLVPTCATLILLPSTEIYEASQGTPAIVIQKKNAQFPTSISQKHKKQKNCTNFQEPQTNDMARYGNGKPTTPPPP